MIFYMETKNSASDRKVGPIDPETGFPTIHASFVADAENIQQATSIFQKRHPNNVAVVYAEPLASPFILGITRTSEKNN